MSDEVKDWSARQEAINDILLNGVDCAEVPASNPEEKHYADAAKESASQQDVQDICNDNEAFSEQIAEEIEQQLQKVSEQMANTPSPYQGEFDLLDKFADCSPEEFPKVWPSVKDSLGQKYPGEFDLDFYDDKFKSCLEEISKLQAGEEKTASDAESSSENGGDGESASKKDWQDSLEEKLNRFEAIKEQILERWEELLIKKQLRWERDQINEEMRNFNEGLAQKAKKVKELKKKLGVFGLDDEIGSGTFWGLADGDFHRVDFNVLERYANLLERDPSIKKLAEMLGRMHQSEKELDEEIYVSTEQQVEWKYKTAIKSELVGIRESNDLNSLLPSEVAFLSDPELEIVFYKKLAEKKLLTYDYYAKMQEQYENIIEVEKSDVRQKAKESEKGPFIICVDTSGSMSGTPEMVAKTLSFAIMKIAVRDKRKAFLISFSTGIRTIELTDMRHSLAKVVDFLQMSFHGGTDATPALEKALSMLKTNDYKLSDVIMVSDFCMGDLGTDLTRKIKSAQKEKTKFHSLVIGYGMNGGVIDCFDSNWFYDESDSNGSIKRLTKDVRSRWLY